MSLPREPRQKMINMMYLVLTALLALNVSAEILNAFKTVNHSLETTNATVDKSTTTIMASLEQKMTEPATAEKARLWYPKAQQAQNYAKAVYSYIQGLKDDILTKSGGDPKNPEKKYKEDNLDITTRMMVEKGEGKKLYDKLDQFKKDMLNIDPEISKEFATSLPIDLSRPTGQDKSTKKWEYAYFHMVPTVATLTILSKFQDDVKTSENKIVSFCHNKVGEVIVRYDTYAAFAQTNSSYVMPGDEMEITAGVGAFSKAAQPVINIAGQNVALDADGAAHKKMNAESSLGDHTINVTVEFVDQEGKKQTITKPIKYTVGQSTASIALDKMNVLYIGVDNPVTIAASGAGDDKIGFSITGGGGTYTKQGGGKYMVRVNSVTDECWINVSVDGKVAGKSKFRVRTIPKPIAIIGPYESGSNVPAGAFKAQSGVGAFVKDFPFELQYRVTKFTISADTDDGYIDDASVNGNSWSSDANATRIINSLKSGRTVMIDEIYAVGPDGRTQHLPSLVYYIK
jgi:gliding motility-associated protein GldM